MHFHGREDKLVPFGGPRKGTPKFLDLQSVEETVRKWAELNGCEAEPMVEKLEDKADDGTTVIRKAYRTKKGNAQVVLLKIEGGGHTWPGIEPPVQFLGRSTKDVSANDLTWEFFKRHQLP